MNTRKVNIVRDADWITILLYLALIFMGWLNIYAAVYNDEHQSIFDFSQRYGKQLIWIGFAIIIGFILFIIENKAYHFFAYIIYGIVVLLLFSVLFFGKDSKAIDPKIGLINFGPYGRFSKGSQQPLTIRAGVIGTRKSKQMFEAWLEKLKYRTR